MSKRSDGRTRINEKSRQKRERLQDVFLDAFAKEGTRAEALRVTGLSGRTVDSWRKEWPEFRARHDRIKQIVKEERQKLRDSDLIFDPNRKLPLKPPFRDWRPLYVGRPVLPHQEHLVDAWFDLTNLVVICYMPPASGKDTTAMDFLLYSLSDNRSLRTCWLMQSEKFSRRRVSGRLEPYLVDPKRSSYKPEGSQSVAPTKSLIDDYGPFRWERGMVYTDGTPIDRPMWNQNEMYFLANAAPEAEPNLWATGINGELYGARVDEMILSDPFTLENQRNPKVRAEQIDWVDGTMESRLDDDGRLLIINTRVAPYDNQGKLLRRFTEGAEIVKQSDDGFYTKFSNGTATVIIPAIQIDENGDEVSYWEDQAPLNGQIKMPDGEIIETEGMSSEIIEQLRELGGKRRRGLRELRARKPSMFAAMYQQAPKASESGEFSELLLNHCDDPTRSLGVAKAGEILVQGVDPARTYGASWVMWGYDPQENTATVVDFFFGTKLGTQGIREKLLYDPVTRYLPRYVCWETNRESAVLDHPDVISVIQDSRAELIRHQTQGGNRNDTEIGVASMSLFMRDATIRFPAFSVEDRQRMEMFKDHFHNWDENEQSYVTMRPGGSGHLPDDICLAAWVGWVQVRKLMRRGRRRLRIPHVPQVVRDRWGARLRAQDRDGIRLAADGEPRKPLLNLEAAYHGSRDDSHDS